MNRLGNPRSGTVGWLGKGTHDRLSDDDVIITVNNSSKNSSSDNLNGKSEPTTGKANSEQLQDFSQISGDQRKPLAVLWRRR